MLRAEGHRSFGFAGFDPDYRYSAKRLEGAERFFRGREDPRLWSVFEPGTVRHDYGYGVRLADAALAEGRMPTAVLAVNDRVAIGLSGALRRAGWTVPEEVAVVGHDNLGIAAHVEPALTTVDQRSDELMKTAAGVLLDWRNGGRPPERALLLPTGLVVRESHRFPSGRTGRAGT